MSKTITSSMISFIDTTDERKIEVSIAANLPTTQIKNSNTGTFSPDFSTTTLVLTPFVYMGASNVSDSGTTYKWYRKYGTGSETEISTSKTISVNQNITDASGIVTYRCEATYKENSSDTGVTNSSSIIFTRVETGLNGQDGTSASVAAQYSSNGTTWSNAISNDSQYIRFSYNNGSTWTSAIKIRGNDGTSVSIKSTAYTTESTLSAGLRITNLYSDSAKTTAINKTLLDSGDAYIVNGYLCVFDSSANNFICTGVIQGPQGDAGHSSYTYIRYADDTSGTNMSTSPSGKTYIGIAVTSSSSAPSNAGSYTWSKYVGENAKDITLNADAQIFKVSSSNTYSPSTITVIGSAANTSITSWQYSTNGGSSFVDTAPSGVSRNGNQVTVSGQTMSSNSVTIKATDGTVYDVVTIFKVSDGTNGSAGAPASLVFLTNEHISFAANSNGQISGQSITTNIVAYTGATKVTPTIGTITDIPSGMIIGTPTTSLNELILPITITANTNLGQSGSTRGTINIPITSPISTNLKLNWSKINAGASASSVRISPSSLFFKSNNGADGTFSPDYIYLYPTFQSASYQGWSYSTNGGSSWTNASGANGLTIGTYNNVANALRISKLSTLYTDSITSISFKCTSTDSNIYDIVSVSKIYDIVDLQIGGRNLAFPTSQEWSEWITPIANISNFTSHVAYAYLPDNKAIGDFYATSIEIEFADVAAGSGGNFRFFTQGAVEDVWSITNVCTNNLVYFASPIADGVYHYERVNTITASNQVDAQKYQIGFRADYWDGVGKFRYRLLQVERGNKVTDWHPALEDIEAYTDDSASKLRNSINGVIDQLVSTNANISTAAASILATVSETYATKDVADDIRKTISTAVTQSADSLQLTFTNQISNVSNTVSLNQQTLEEYIRFVGATIELGKSNNNFIARLSNEKLAFLQEGSEIAYISNNKLYITDAEIKNKLTLGDSIKGYWDWIPRANGNLSLKWRNS